MHFLLIDFGASYITSILFNKESDSFSDLKAINSPFITTDKLSKDEIYSIIKNILNQYKSAQAVVMCGILGGNYLNNIYYSWKCNEQTGKPTEESCLLSELFKDQPTYHLHSHHSKNSAIKGLQLLGYINNVKFYSSLGDTNCVIESVNLKTNELLINLGTGSQVIKRNEDGTHNIISFIPSGRALNSFKVFFDSLGVNLFDEFAKLNINDLEQSTLIFDLNIFPQSFKFKGGGLIKNIDENNFNVRNFISSLFRSYIDQYIEIIKTNKIDTIYFAGGISKKYPLIQKYIQHKTDIYTQISSFQYEDTHIGMSNLIKQYL